VFSGQSQMPMETAAVGNGSLHARRGFTAELRRFPVSNSSIGRKLSPRYIAARFWWTQCTASPIGCDINVLMMGKRGNDSVDRDRLFGSQSAGSPFPGPPLRG
jgi:hypothetical protein